MDVDYIFVEDLAEEFTCQVCMKLLIEPQLTDCCGQHFCRACLVHWFQEKGKKQCPHCRSEAFTHILYKPLQRKINELKVYCSNRKEGCKETMKIEELKRHLSTDNTNGCGYVTMRCTNKNCEETCLRKDLASHTKNTCEYRMVKCQFCGEVGQYWHITTTGYKGHIHWCPEYPVDCPRECSTVGNLKRKDLEAHREVCPLEPVECPFREAGCKEQLVRKDFDDHIQSNTQQHLLILMNSYKILLRKNKELELLKTTVAGITTELEALKPRVRDRDSVAKSLERITETLSHASLRLEKEGDQLIFNFSSTCKDWTSPVFQVNKIKMTIVLTQENNTLSLFWMSGEFDGKYEVEVKCEVCNKDTQEKLGGCINNMLGYLCTKCTDFPAKRKIFKSKAKESNAGQKILLGDTFLTLWSKTFPTYVATVTLKAHNCPGTK